ncbi:MAG TPA: hypothetical protein VNL15_00640 [Dehalococcoidia bacterium]|nr:hypothetical protein [Dehalococcoidia bacterium]
MIIETSDRVQLSETELEELIDTEARKRLRISGEEFKRRYREGKLPDSPAVREIAMLIKLAA